MAANTKANIAIGSPAAAGAIFIGKAETALPTDAATALAVGFVNIGYIAEDGLTNGSEVEADELRAWGGEIVKTVETSRKETFAFTAIETNAAVLKLCYGDSNVTVTEVTGAIKITKNGAELPYLPIAINIALGKNRIQRIVIPEGKVTEVGELVYNNSDPLGYPITISAIPDSSGNTSYTYIEEVV